ncbi:uncharacterized protein LOC117120995 [Anneissia japonica]|uniref:uncharacterized protein LOC117120995 n=1 Tax=Anneissia japonica TaxID=1529436 RepID=UPI00142566E4|nr:uncharacterized protein LOC117120995 [Anneissia japonica]
MVHAFHDGMEGRVNFDGTSSRSFDIKNGVKQGCVLAPTLFGIFFAMMLRHAFDSCDEGIYIKTRSDGRLFNLSRLKAKTKTSQLLLYSKENYSLLMMPQWSPIQKKHSYDLSLDPDLEACIGKATATFARLQKRVWKNNYLTICTKMQVYCACVLSTLLYSSEAWTTYARHEKRLNTFHMCSLRRILGIKWQDKITAIEVVRRSQLPSIAALLWQRRMRWIGHLNRQPDGRIPKDILFGELSDGKRCTGRPKDVYRNDMHLLNIDSKSWECLSKDRSAWKQQIPCGLK